MISLYSMNIRPLIEICRFSVPLSSLCFLSRNVDQLSLNKWTLQTIFYCIKPLLLIPINKLGISFLLSWNMVLSYHQKYDVRIWKDSIWAPEKFTSIISCLQLASYKTFWCVLGTLALSGLGGTTFCFLFLLWHSPFVSLCEGCISVLLVKYKRENT